MIRPINITPLNTSKDLFFKCDKCKLQGTMHLENLIINTDNKSNPISPMEDFECPRCHAKL